MEWDAEKLNRWGKLAAKFFIACIPVIGPGASVIAEEGANAALDAAKGKWGSIPEHIRRECEKQLLAGTEEQKLLVRTAAETLLGQLDLLERYDATQDLAAAMTDAGLRRYGAQYDESEQTLLSRCLEPVLAEAIQELKTQKEHDPAFKIAYKEALQQWKDTMKTAVAQNAKRLDEQGQRLNEHDRRISALEEFHWASDALVVNAAGEYQRKWSQTLFLDREKEIPLRRVYQLPHYDKGETDLHSRLQQAITSVKGPEERMLVVLGQPGSGKTTLINYLLNRCSIPDDRKVYVFPFTRLKVDWQEEPGNLSAYILKAIFGTTEQQKLNHSLLILDGLDEVDMGNNQTEFLNRLYSQWIESGEIKNFSLIVTCRVNRIPEVDDLDMPHLELCPLDEGQMLEFAAKYKPAAPEIGEKLGALVKKDSAIREILGIPIILYMVLALGVDVSSNMGKMDIYSRIFSLDGKNSIYLRRNYDSKHSITAGEVQKIHAFSKAAAMEMWKTDPEKTCLRKSKCQEIAQKIVLMTEETKDAQLRDILIGQYFIEGQKGQELYFVHRSIYEYFVALSLFDWMQALQRKTACPEDLFKAMESADKAGDKPQNADLAAFADALGSRDICRDAEIKEGLLWLMQKAAQKKTDRAKNTALSPDWWREFLAAFQLYGLEQAANHKTRGIEQVFVVEARRFFNLILLIKLTAKARGEAPPFHVWNYSKDESPLLFCVPNIEKNLSEVNLAGANLYAADLGGADLGGANLHGAKLSEADLCGANLRKASLGGADLGGANLHAASLGGADLGGADLRAACFRAADLRGADLREANLIETDLQEADLRGADLRRADLYEAKLGRANLRKADLSRADLSGGDLHEADLRGVDLSSANLSGTILKFAEIYRSTFKGAFNADTTVMILHDDPSPADVIEHADPDTSDVTGHSDQESVWRKLIKFFKP